MEFDKSRIFTSVNADEIKVGSKVIVADTYDGLKEKFDVYSSNPSAAILSEVLSSHYRDRFIIEGYSCHFNLAYLISEPEEKKLEWTDLKIGDIVSNGARTFIVTGIDTKGDCGSHIYFGSEWMTDGDLSNWKKVGNDNVRTVC